MMITKGLVDLKPGLLFCEKLAKKYKVYYANGNHELRLKDEKYDGLYDELNKSAKKMGICRLEDSCKQLEDICIYGLDIDKKYYKKLDNAEFDKAYIESKLGAVNDKSFSILLAHSPLFLNAYADWGADLALSGHFHGGTVRVWKDIGLMTPQIHFFSDMVHGLKKKDNTNLIISSGLGTHSINIRQKVLFTEAGLFRTLKTSIPLPKEQHLVESCRSNGSRSRVKTIGSSIGISRISVLDWALSIWATTNYSAMRFTAIRTYLFLCTAAITWQSI